MTLIFIDIWFQLLTPQTKTNHSPHQDHRAIMVLFGCRGGSTSSQWYGVHYITGFQPTRHSSTNSITRQTIKEKVNSVTATHTRVPTTQSVAPSASLQRLPFWNINLMSSPVSRQTVLLHFSTHSGKENVRITSHVGKRRVHQVPHDLCKTRVHISSAVSNNTAMILL